MEQFRTQKGLNALWNALKSVRFTIVLLIVLALVSILGTVIPQQESAMQFAQRLSPGAFRLLKAFQLFDVYHSFWFRLIIGALVLNLVFCSVDRFPSSWRLFRSRPRPDRIGVFHDLPPGQRLSLKSDIRESGARVRRLLERRYAVAGEKETGGNTYLVADKGRHAYFGVYLIHFSVLLILLGGLLGSFLGFEAYVKIPEGETVDTVLQRKSGRPLHLGFQVRCDRFSVEFYDNRTPKEFRSDISFLTGERVVQSGTLRVNHPLTFAGITFYQASYGTEPGGKIFLKIAASGRSPEILSLEVDKNRGVELPGGEGEFRILRIEPDLMGTMGPAALVQVRPRQGEDIEFWVFRDREEVEKRFPPHMLRSPKLNPAAFKPYTFFLEGFESTYYTGLQVNRDPGVPLVWAGFILIVVGLFVTFFASHRRIWVRLEPEGEGTTLSIAGRASRNPVGLERDLERIMERIQAAQPDRGADDA
ncbi:MAG: cytochrome c biogenesis protein ResB [Deltaproteobacteria bacterium]|nr:cytochrome c biogenesis protein ResB [Deltaproteobacteria bacterium]